MTLISVYAPPFVHSFCAILNLVACSIFSAIRVYHQRKYRTEVPRLNAIGLSCMLAGLLYCFALLNTTTDWYFGDDRYCDVSMKLAAATYTIHRAVLYMFIILRLDVVNKINFIEQRIIDIGKAVIGAVGISMVVTTAVLANGVPDQYYSCGFQFNGFIVLVLLFLLDVIICVVGTWMFTRPLRNTLRSHDSGTLSLMLSKTKFWSIICLLSTLIAMFTVALVDGIAGVVGFDCSITSFSLLMMMKPVKLEVASRSSSNIKKKSRVDAVVELKNVS